MHETVHSASCSCGDVTVTAQGAPAFQAVCACGDCQERTGSAFGMSVYFTRPQIVEMTGKPTVYRRVSAKGRWLDFRFCPICGVNVWWDVEFERDLIGVAGSLLKDHVFDPEFAVWDCRKPEFVTYAKDMRVYQRGSLDG